MKFSSSRVSCVLMLKCRRCERVFQEQISTREDQISSLWGFEKERCCWKHKALSLKVSDALPRLLVKITFNNQSYTRPHHDSTRVPWDLTTHAPVKQHHHDVMNMRWDETLMSCWCSTEHSFHNQEYRNKASVGIWCTYASNTSWFWPCGDIF